MDLSGRSLKPGEVVVVRPTDDVELEFHGLADQAGPLLVLADVEEGGVYTYVVETSRADMDRFVVRPRRHRNVQAEKAIEECGGQLADDVPAI